MAAVYPDAVSDTVSTDQPAAKPRAAPLLQERAAQLAEHEESLDAWKRQFKEQAMQQIGDRRRALADWQARLEAHDADLAERRASFEVGHRQRCFPHGSGRQCFRCRGT